MGAHRSSATPPERPTRTVYLPRLLQMNEPSSAPGNSPSRAPLLADVDRLGRAIEAGGVALWEWHVGEDLMQVTPALAETLGLPLLAFPTARFFALVEPSGLPLLRAAMSEAMASGGSFAHEFRINREDSGAG